MKKILLIIAIAITGAMAPRPASAQAQEIAQLLLNIEKLRQFKQILSDLKAGYDILYKGYSTIKNISEGNFKLHDAFLDALLKVNPAVRNYYKVGGIIDMQILLVTEYKAAYSRLSGEGNLTLRELEYMAGVYGNLLKLSLRNLDELATVITADKLRMSDDERLKAVDAVFEQMQEKLMFLRHFNGNASVLSAQRGKDRHDAWVMQQIEGLKD